MPSRGGEVDTDAGLSLRLAPFTPFLILMAPDPSGLLTSFPPPSHPISDVEYARWRGEPAGDRMGSACRWTGVEKGWDSGRV